MLNSNINNIKQKINSRPSFLQKKINKNEIEIFPKTLKNEILGKEEKNELKEKIKKKFSINYFINHKKKDITRILKPNTSCKIIFKHFEIEGKKRKKNNKNFSLSILKNQKFVFQNIKRNAKISEPLYIKLKEKCLKNKIKRYSLKKNVELKFEENSSKFLSNLIHKKKPRRLFFEEKKEVFGYNYEKKKKNLFFSKIKKNRSKILNRIIPYKNLGRDYNLNEKFPFATKNQKDIHNFNLNYLNINET